jgi:hypothetical protein
MFFLYTSEATSSAGHSSSNSCTQQSFSFYIHLYVLSIQFDIVLSKNFFVIEQERENNTTVSNLTQSTLIVAHPPHPEHTHELVREKSSFCASSHSKKRKFSLHFS